MRKLKSSIKNFKTSKYALIVFLYVFGGFSMNAQIKSINPLDNTDKGLVFAQEQQEELTNRLTTYWTKKLTPEKTEKWNAILTKNLTATWSVKLSEKLSTEIEEKLTTKTKEKWDPILNEKYPNSVQYYRQ